MFLCLFVLIHPTLYFSTLVNDSIFQKPPWPAPDSHLHRGRFRKPHNPVQCWSRRPRCAWTPPWWQRVCSWASTGWWVSHSSQVRCRRAGRRGSSGQCLHSRLEETHTAHLITKHSFLFSPKSSESTAAIVETSYWGINHLSWSCWSLLTSSNTLKAFPPPFIHA